MIKRKEISQKVGSGQQKLYALPPRSGLRTGKCSNLDKCVNPEQEWSTFYPLGKPRAGSANSDCPTGQMPLFVNTNPFEYLYIAYGCFDVMMAEWTHCNTDLMACRD